MLQSVRLYFISAFSLLGVGFAFAVQEKPWLKEYTENREYNGVYVVKKINAACTSYQTFLLDKNGNKLTPAFRDIGDFSSGLAEFVPFELNEQKQGLHGFIDRQGKIVVPPTYVGTDKFYKGKTWVIYRSGLQYGLSYIDSTGKTLYKIPISYYKNDFLISKATVDFVCNRDAREDIIWWKKNEIFLLNWNFSPFIENEIKKSKGIYHFLYKGKYGIIDKNMILRVPLALDDIDPKYKFSGQGLERVKYGDAYSFINVFTGELIGPFQYTDTRKPTAGLFWVKKNNKWGCIDKTGKTRIAFQYDEASGFTAEHRAAVAKNGKFGHIDKTGKVRTPLTYEFASYFNNGLSMVRVVDKYGYIDTLNHFVIEPSFDSALPFDKKTTTAERNGLKYELTLDGAEAFIGFTDGWNAVFILIGVFAFAGASIYIFPRFRKKQKPVKPGLRK